MDARQSRVGFAPTTPRAIVESIFRFKTRFVIAFFGVLFLVAAYAILTPRRYKSEMSLTVEGGNTSQAAKTEQADTLPAQVITREDQLLSAAELLRSRDIISQVLTQVGELPSGPKKSSNGQKAEDTIINEFSRNLVVEPIPKSNLIHVTYSARTPRLATDTLHHLLATAAAKTRISQAATLQPTLIAAEQERYRHELEVAQQNLSRYRQNSHIVSYAEDEAALDKQILQLKQELQETDTGLSELTERLALGQKELRQLTQRQLTQQKQMPNVAAIEQLTTMLAGFHNQKTSLLTKYQPTDRLVQEVDQQIVNTSEALHSAAEMQSSEETTDVNPLWQQLTVAVSKDALDRSAAMARRRSEVSHLAELQAALSRTEISADGFTRLQGRVSELEDGYQLYTRKRYEEQLALAPNYSAFTVVHQPTFSPVPSSPNSIFILLASLLPAPLLALGTVIISDLARNTVTSLDELRRVTRLPVLALNPFIHSAYLLAKQRVDAAAHRIDEEQPATTRISPFLRVQRLLSRFPLQTTASMFMSRTLGGPTNKGPTPTRSSTISLPHGLSP